MNSIDSIDFRHWLWSHEVPYIYSSRVTSKRPSNAEGRKVKACNHRPDKCHRLTPVKYGYHYERMVKRDWAVNVYGHPRWLPYPIIFRPLYSQPCRTWNRWWEWVRLQEKPISLADMTQVRGTQRAAHEKHESLCLDTPAWCRPLLSWAELSCLHWHCLCPMCFGEHSQAGMWNNEQQACHCFGTLN